MYDSRAARIARNLLTIIAAASIGCAQAATITVNSLADDVFPDGTGAIFDAGNNPLTLVSPKCTLRMAIAAANLDLAVGGAPNGCAAGSAGADTIVFAGALNLPSTPGTITLASKAMSEAPASYGNGGNVSALAISQPLTITGPGSTQLTIDGALTAVDGRRMVVASDGNQDADSPLTITGLRFHAGRALDQSSGCMFSGESTTLNDVVFEGCESVGGPTSAGYGGALGLGNQTAGSVAPTIVISNSRFSGNRAVRGTSAQRSENGALFIGSGTRKVGAVTLTNVTMSGNSADRTGAMLILNAASVSVSGSTFSGNAATGALTSSASNASGNGRYGAFNISSVTGNVTINGGTRVHANLAHEERGGFGITTVDGTVTIDNVDISGNYVNRGRIGGFEVLTDSFDVNGNCEGLKLRPVVIGNVRVFGNSVASNTAGFRVGCSGALTMTDSQIRANETRGYRMTPADTVATGNSAGQLFQATDATAASSTATLTRVQIRENFTRATVAGGGGFNVFTVFGLGAFTADTMRFVGNSVAASGGLTLNARGAGRNYLVVNSEFSGNYGHDFPALFMETDGSYTLRNSTVSGNVTAGGGTIVKFNANTNTPGGINVAIEHSTIARNTANFEEALGAGVWANQPNAGVATNTLFTGANATAGIRNSILGPRVPGYVATNTIGFDPSITAITAANTLLEWAGGAPASFCGGTGVLCNVGAMLNALADNGDPLASVNVRTMAPMAGSPAIDSGGPVTGSLATDARGSGFPRVVGAAVDMGAHESAPASLYGCTLDVDGNAATDALTDGLVLVRAMFGLTGTSATNAAIGGGATRASWSQIRSYLNANCGTNFGP